MEYQCSVCEELFEEHEMIGDLCIMCYIAIEEEDEDEYD